MRRQPTSAAKVRSPGRRHCRGVRRTVGGGQQGDHYVVDAESAAGARRRAHRCPVRRRRRASVSEAWSAGRTHPGAVAQQILPGASGRSRPFSTMRRITRMPVAMRADTFPPDGGFAGSDPDMAFRQLIIEAGVDIAILEPLRGVNAPPRSYTQLFALAHQQLAGEPLAGRPLTTGTSGGGGRSRRDRGPVGAAAQRDRALGRPPIHGTDSDQCGAPAIVGRPEV